MTGLDSASLRHSVQVAEASAATRHAWCQAIWVVHNPAGLCPNPGTVSSTGDDTALWGSLGSAEAAFRASAGLPRRQATIRSAPRPHNAGRSVDGGPK